MTLEERKKHLLKYKEILKEPYIKKDYTWYEASFKNLYELKSYLASNPLINYECFGSVKSKETGNLSYYEMSYEDAINFLDGGYKKNIEKMFELKSELKKGIEFPSVSRKVAKSFTGSRICPNSFVTNNPKRFYKLERIPQRKFITIHMNMALPYNQTISQVLTRGALLYNLVDVLEENNYNVTLNTFFLLKQDDELIYIKIRLKDVNSRLRVNNSLFPLTSPAFFRRIILRVMESMPVENDYWGSMGYGGTVQDKETLDLLSISEYDIYIGKPSEMNIYGKNLLDDTRNFLDYIDMEKYVRVKVK